MIVHFIPLGSSVPVIPGIFDIVHTRNRGSAFGFMATFPDRVRIPFFLAVSTLALVCIVLYFLKSQEERKGTLVSLALILGGALGNIWDRIRLGEVIDFLSFHWYDASVQWSLGGWQVHFRLEWPAFNVADSAISIAVLWVMISQMFNKKKR